MEDVDGFDRPAIVPRGGERTARCVALAAAQRAARAADEDIGRGHRPKIGDERVETAVGEPHSVNIGDRHDQAGGGEQMAKAARLDPRMDVGCGAEAARLVGCQHRRAQHGQRIVPGHRADQQAVRAEQETQPGKHQRQLVDGVERADGQAQVKAPRRTVEPVFILGNAAGRCGEQWSGIDHRHAIRNRLERLFPARHRAAEQQGGVEPAGDVAKPFEAVVECPLQQEGSDSLARRSVAPQAPQVGIEQGIGHCPALCAGLVRATSTRMAAAGFIFTAARAVLDFALPARCPGCGIIVDDVHLFCATCWGKLEWLTGAGCESCGLPLPSATATSCAACLAKPPRFDAARAAVGYAEVSRGLALRLKHGRKTGAARTMARYMERLLAGVPGDALLVPVPLHRRRLWLRGFNQSMLLARHLSARTGHAVEPRLLRRTRATPSLAGRNARQRAEAVRGAFEVRDGNKLSGRTVVLIDDVHTTGSTANACAGALKRAGAQRVELVVWARAIRPSQAW